MRQKAVAWEELKYAELEDHAARDTEDADQVLNAVEQDSEDCQGHRAPEDEARALENVFHSVDRTKLTSPAATMVPIRSVSSSDPNVQVRPARRGFRSVHRSSDQAYAVALRPLAVQYRHPAAAVHSAVSDYLPS